MMGYGYMPPYNAMGYGAMAHPHFAMGMPGGLPLPDEGIANMPVTPEQEMQAQKHASEKPIPQSKAKKEFTRKVRETQEKTKAFFAPDEKGNPWYKDNRKIGIMGLGLGTLAVLGLIASAGKSSMRTAEGPLDFLRDAAHGRAFKDQQKWLMDEMDRGIGGWFNPKKKNIKKRMKHYGSTLYLENLAKQLNEHQSGPVARIVNSEGPKERTFKEASDIWLLHKELLNNPKAYKDYGFNNLSEAVQRTHAVMDLHLKSLKKELGENNLISTLTHNADAKEKRDLINGYEMLSEKFLDDYILKHTKDAETYPVGRGAVSLAKEVYLRDTRKLIKQNRHPEALQKMRNFLILASGRALEKDAGASNPLSIFSPKEWNQFMRDYKDVLIPGSNHSVLYYSRLSPLNAKHLKGAVEDFRKESTAIMHGAKTPHNKLNYALYNLSQSSGVSSSYDEIRKELEGGNVYTPGTTFRFLHDILQKHRREAPTLSSMA